MVFYEILEEHGFEVYLVNARHTKNLRGVRAMCRKVSGY
jgi:transposase